MKKILLIEDNRDILDNMSEILELAGYEVYLAEDGRIGFKQALLCRPDLIISDIMMPVLDGFGLLHLIKKKSELRDIPFIFLTAKTDRMDFRKGMDMGADDYITKPFNDTELLNAIEGRLEKEDRRKEETRNPFLNHPSMSVQDLIKDRETNEYKKKQMIILEDNKPHFLFYIVKGKLKAFKISESGKELIVGLYTTGDFLGYTALLEGGRYKVSVKALEDAEIALVPGSVFFDAIKNNSEIAMHFIKLLAVKNNQKVDQMLHLAYASVRKRVANAILFLRDTYQTDNKPFSFHITRQELSHLSGTTTESLIRTLSDFKKEKCIKIDNSQIEILDEKKLHRMIN